MSCDISGCPFADGAPEETAAMIAELESLCAQAEAAGKQSSRAAIRHVLKLVRRGHGLEKPRRPKHIASGERKRKVDPEQVRQLLQDPSLRHTDIAARVGVSRERVRQIALSFGDTGRGRHARRKQHRRATRFAGRIPRLKFSIWVNQALAVIGYRYCSSCYGAVTQERFYYLRKNSKKYQVRCKDCTAAQQRERYAADPAVREKMRAYHQTERAKKYQREYAAKNREDINRKMRQKQIFSPVSLRILMLLNERPRQVADLMAVRNEYPERHGNCVTGSLVRLGSAGYIRADRHMWIITEAGRVRLLEQKAKLEAA